MGTDVGIREVRQSDLILERFLGDDEDFLMSAGFGEELGTKVNAEFKGHVQSIELTSFFGSDAGHVVDSPTCIANQFDEFCDPRLT